MMTKISVFGRISGVCQPYVSRISAVYPPYISRILAVCQPSVSRMSALCPPYIRRMSAVCQTWNGRMSALCLLRVSHMSSVCQPYIRRMSAIPNLPICLVFMYSSLMMGEHRRLAGQWESVSQKNLDPLLKKLGAPLFVRKTVLQTKFSQKISFEGPAMKITSVSNNYTNVKILPLDGSNFKDEIFQKPYAATASISDSGSITIQGKLGKLNGDKTITISRKLDDSGDRMILTTTIEEVECVRVFVRK